MHRIMPLSQALRFQTRFGELLYGEGQGQYALVRDWYNNPQLREAAAAFSRKTSYNVLLGKKKDVDRIGMAVRSDLHPKQKPNFEHFNDFAPHEIDKAISWLNSRPLP